MTIDLPWNKERKRCYGGNTGRITNPLNESGDCGSLIRPSSRVAGQATTMEGGGIEIRTGDC